jgi:hypothetical protein
MEIRSFVANLFIGQMQGETEGQRNMIKLKATYRNFSKAPVRDEYQFCQGVGASLPCIDRPNSNFKARRKMM